MRLPEADITVLVNAIAAQRRVTPLGVRPASDARSLSSAPAFNFQSVRLYTGLFLCCRISVHFIQPCSACLCMIGAMGCLNSYSNQTALPIVE